MRGEAAEAEKKEAEQEEDLPLPLTLPSVITPKGIRIRSRRGGGREEDVFRERRYCRVTFMIELVGFAQGLGQALV